MIQKDFLSINAQSRPDYLKAKADAYFDYDWLFQLLWTEFKNDVAKTASANFCDNLQQQRQKRFIWAFIESHRSSLNEIKETYENLFGDQNFALELYEQRLALIDKFCENPLSLRWKHVYQSPKQKKPNNSWQIFADNLRKAGPIMVEAHHSCYEIVHRAHENASEGNPQKSYRPVSCSQDSSEDRPQASNVQKLDQEGLPSRHRDIVHPVIHCL